MCPLPNKSAKKRIWDELKEIALEDGQITSEEQELMANIIVDVEKYSSLIEHALEDGIIDKREKRELFEQRIEVVEKAYASARNDMVISDDEKALLKTIVRIIIEVEKDNFNR